MSWVLSWNFDKPNYAPGEVAVVSFWLDNLGDTPLYISDVSLEFDFGVYSLEDIVSGVVYPRRKSYLGSVRLSIPSNVAGQKKFTVKYHVYEYVNNAWVDLGFYTSERTYFISIYPRPLYKVFVSRSIRDEDKWITDPIVETIREWGFETVTVGIEVKVPEEQVPMKVKEEIMNADALIAIATPRFLDSLTGLWKTLEWLHAETGIAYGLDKPLLILKDRRIHLGGLPGYLATFKQAPVIEFDPFNLDELKAKLSAVMPGFREWIADKRRQEFFEALAKLAVIALAIIALPGIIDSILGSSKKRNPS
jgi:hypothetical protein